MGKTTVDLTKTAEVIKNKLMPIYGLKNILSAGLLILNKLSAEDQIKTVADVNQIKEPADVEKLTTEQKYRQLKELLKELKPGLTKILNKRESMLVEQIRQELGPDALKHLSSSEQAILDEALASARADILRNRHKKSRRSSRAG